jgi:integrase
MKPVERADGRVVVFVPRKLSRSGKRESYYFTSKNQALKFISEFRTEHREHGRTGVTAEQREAIAYVQRELGGLEMLPEIVRHWRLTGAHIVPMIAEQAVAHFVQWAEQEHESRRTTSDIRSRLHRFADYFNGRRLHELTTADLELYLGTIQAGWNRWSMHKRLRAFFRFAVRRGWIARDPVEPIPATKTPIPERGIYTPSQFKHLLWTVESGVSVSASGSADTLAYLVLAGYCFMRNGELVRTYANEDVLQWSDILWDEGLIHVRDTVAKGTRRGSGDERYTPLSSAAKRWLEPIRKESGPCVAIGLNKFGELWRQLTDALHIERIDNGLRHSAISYSIAAYPENGVALTSEWAGNSEATIRKHYKRLVKPAEGREWFSIEHYENELEQTYREGKRLIEQATGVSLEELVAKRMLEGVPRVDRYGKPL